MASNTRSQTQPSSTSTSTPTVKPVSILFVCLGNICRSPMAEGTFRALTSHPSHPSHPLISRIDSCGTGAYHAGDPPDPRTMAVLQRAGITTYEHQARKIRVPRDFADFDYVIGMDEANVADLRRMAGRAEREGGVKGAKEKVWLYGAFGGKSEAEEVQDPWYGGGEGFEIAFEQVQRFGRGLLRHIQGEGEKGEGS